MKKSYIVVALMLSILVVSGCKKEQNTEFTSRLDLTNPEVIERCDTDKNGEISAEELTICEPRLGIPDMEDVVDRNTTDDSSDIVDNRNTTDDSSQNLGSNLQDVRADYPGGYVIYDSKTGVAEMSIEGEIMYIDIEGNYFLKADGVWTSIKGYGDGGFFFPDFQVENTKLTPLMIPYANMPYIFTYQEVIKLAQGTMSKCNDGSDCEEFLIIGPEGNVNLKFNSNKLLVEMFVDSESIKYTHGVYNVTAPQAQSVQDYANSLM